MATFMEKLRDFKKGRIIQQAELGVRRDKLAQQKRQQFEEKADEIIRREKKIAEVRSLQVKRAKAEASIFRARASVKQSQQKIQGPLRNQLMQPPATVRPFPRKQKKGKKKQKRQIIQKKQGTPGLGTSFRSL